MLPSTDLLQLKIVLSEDIRLIEISLNHLHPSTFAYDESGVTLFSNWMSGWAWYLHAPSNLETLVINIAIESEWDCLRCDWRSLDNLLTWDGVPSLKKTLIRVMLHSADNTLWQSVKDHITKSLPLMDSRGIIEFSAVDVYGRVLTLPAS
jgi:hypothetical protein